jgi:Ca2+-binding EF-hand superfamily protein
MGGSIGCFRSRLAPSLTTKEINNLSNKLNLTRKDIEEWYEDFVHCYPHGHLSRRQFVFYYQQLRDEHSEQFKPLIKQLFELFDLNKDQKLDFEEFVLLTMLTGNGSIYEKMKLIFTLYDKEKDKSFSRNEIKDLLRSMFDLFDIPSSKSNITEVINIIFQRNNINRDQKIEWNQFSEEIINDQALIQQLISLESDNSFIQRSERF